MTRTLLLGMLVAVATFGCATTTRNSPADTRAARNSLESSAERVDPMCVRDTGSRIKRTGDYKPCVAQPGTTYTQDQLDQTGRLDVAEALRYLDPRFH